MQPIKKLSTRHREIAQYRLMFPGLTQEEMGKKFGLTQVQINHIYKSPVFIDYYESLLQDRWKEHENEAQQKMFELMQDGNFNATKYILDSLGYQPKQQVQLETNNSIKINITND